MMWRSFISYVAVFILLFGGVSVALANPSQAVWIDSDPACGHAKTDDVDDCWALLLALRSEVLEIHGISTLFGNGSGEKSFRTASKLIQRFGNEGSMPTIYRGANEAISPGNPKRNAASHAMAKALANGPLTIIALGPLTNVATLILRYPEHLANIKRVIVIAGQRPEPGLGFYPGTSRLFHLHDLNFRKDVVAFNIVLRSSVPVTLVPYEVAAKISIQSTDLGILENGGSQSRWLGQISKPWLEFWNTRLRSEGFYPFDSLAIGLLTLPSLFTCENIPAKIHNKRALFVTSRDNLLVSHNFNEKRYVEYCHDVDQTFKLKLIEALL
jgi:pyrimidine-specific ribonucleoside hydrolase